MDDDGVGSSNCKDAQPQPQPQLPDQATSSSSSSAESESRWRPTKLVFAPYSPSLQAATSSLALRVVVRRPVSVSPFLFLALLVLLLLFNLLFSILPFACRFCY